MLNLTPQKTCKTTSTKAKVSLLQTGLEHQHGPAKAKAREHPRDLQYLRCDHLTHRIHGTDIGWLIFIVNVGAVNIPYMDPMGYKSTLFFVHRFSARDGQ